MLKWVFPNSLSNAFYQWIPPHHGSFFKKVWLASFFIILWTIWKERNERIFNNKDTSLSALKELILLRLSWWIKGWGDPFPYSTSQLLRVPQCLNWIPSQIRLNAIPSVQDSNWVAPPPSYYKWSVDASLNHHNSRCAIGGILRNDQGDFVCMFSSPVPPMEINCAEVLAIHKAMQISLSKEEYRNQNFQIESDSQNAVNLCNNSIGGPWNMNFILNFIRTQLKSRNFSLLYKGRASNSIADGLAKQGIHRNSDFVAWL